jgi:hypothetical protein
MGPVAGRQRIQGSTRRNTWRDKGLAACGRNPSIERAIGKKHRIIMGARKGFPEIMATGICGIRLDPAINRYLAARNVQVCRGPCCGELSAAKTKGLVDLAWGVAKPIAVPRFQCVATLDIIRSTITGPPANHVCRWRRARLTLACAAGVEDVEYFGCSQHSIEGFDFVDATIEGSRSSVASYPNRGWD